MGDMRARTLARSRSGTGSGKYRWQSQYIFAPRRSTKQAAYTSECRGALECAAGGLKIIKKFFGFLATFLNNYLYFYLYCGGAGVAKRDRGNNDYFIAPIQA